MMKSNPLKVAALGALILGFSLGSTALASGENETKFTGIVESLPNTAGFIGDWRVDGRTVHVTSATRMEQEDGQVVVGAKVKVEGTTRSDNSVDATEIEVKSNVAGDDGRDELKGAIDSLPAGQGFVGDWRVSGRTVHVNLATILNQEHGAFLVGALVEVKGTMRADGSIDATRIEVQGPSSGTGGEGQSANLKGTIQSLPSGSSLIGDWAINNQTVHVTSSTKLKTQHGAFAVGTRVKVKGLRLADGSIVATKIQVRDSN